MRWPIVRCGRVFVLFRNVELVYVQPVRCCAIRNSDEELCVGLEETLCRWREHFEGVLNIRSSFNQAALDS